MPDEATLARRWRVTSIVATSLAGTGAVWALLVGYDFLALASQLEDMKRSELFLSQAQAERLLLREAGVANLGSIGGVQAMGLGFVTLGGGLAVCGGFAARRPSAMLGMVMVFGIGLLLMGLADTDWIACAFGLGAGAALVIGFGDFLNDD